MIRRYSTARAGCDPQSEPLRAHDRIRGRRRARRWHAMLDVVARREVDDDVGHRASVHHVSRYGARSKARIAVYACGPQGSGVDFTKTATRSRSSLWPVGATRDRRPFREQPVARSTMSARWVTALRRIGDVALARVRQRQRCCSTAVQIWSARSAMPSRHEVHALFGANKNATPHGCDERAHHDQHGLHPAMRLGAVARLGGGVSIMSPCRCGSKSRCMIAPPIPPTARSGAGPPCHRCPARCRATIVQVRPWR